MKRWLAALAVVALLQGPVAAQPETRVGQVDSVQLVDASALGGETFLILTLENGASFQVPDQRRLAAGRGVLLEVHYLSPKEEGVVPELCRAIVLGIPIEVDGEEVLREAERPFEIYRNPRPDCD